MLKTRSQPGAAQADHVSIREHSDETAGGGEAAGGGAERRQVHKAQNGPRIGWLSQKGIGLAWFGFSLGASFDAAASQQLRQYTEREMHNGDMSGAGSREQDTRHRPNETNWRNVADTVGNEATAAAAAQRDDEIS